MIELKKKIAELEKSVDCLERRKKWVKSRIRKVM